MASVQFYHLTSSPLERALPKLLEKALAAGFMSQVAVGSDEMAEQLNQLLWTYDPNSFLPHGTKKDGHAAEQPVLLVTEIEAEHPAKALFVTDGRMPQGAEKFERILDIFDGGNPEAVAAARQRWTAYKNAGHGVSYMQQTENGWQKAA